MTDRTKLLVHINRISTVFRNAILNGPDGSLEGKFKDEHPHYINHSLGFYIMGCLAYLTSEGGEYSWKKSSPTFESFDEFAQSFPEPPRSCYLERGISEVTLDALACIRNAVAHNSCDLAANNDKESLEKVASANIPGVILDGSIVTLEEPLLDFVRQATYAVRKYHGDE